MSLRRVAKGEHGDSAIIFDRKVTDGYDIHVLAVASPVKVAFVLLGTRTWELRRCLRTLIGSDDFALRCSASMKLEAAHAASLLRKILTSVANFRGRSVDDLPRFFWNCFVKYIPEIVVAK